MKRKASTGSQGTEKQAPASKQQTLAKFLKPAVPVSDCSRRGKLSTRLDASENVVYASSNSSSVAWKWGRWDDSGRCVFSRPRDPAGLKQSRTENKSCRGPPESRDAGLGRSAPEQRPCAAGGGGRCPLQGVVRRPELRGKPLLGATFDTCEGVPPRAYLPDGRSHPPLQDAGHPHVGASSSVDGIRSSGGWGASGRQRAAQGAGPSSHGKQEDG